MAEQEAAREPGKPKKKRRASSIILLVVAILCFVVAGVCAFMLGSKVVSEQHIEQQYQDLSVEFDKSGKKIGGTRPAQNFFIYWDGDLEREILDGNKISKMTGANKIDRIFTANGCGSNNSSKSVPCMTADLFGDWREELIMRTDDNSKLRIWCMS